MPGSRRTAWSCEVEETAASLGGLVILQQQRAVTRYRLNDLAKNPQERFP
jgi:hypothetical protein